MRNFIDLLTFSEAVAEAARALGWTAALIAGKEVNYIEPRITKEIRPISGRINIIRGGSLDVNRMAVQGRGVQVLLDAVDARNRNFDSAIARLAAENGIALGISLRSLVETQGVTRARLMRNLQWMIALAIKMGVEIVIVSGAQDKNGVRAPQDLASVGALLGLTEAKALWAVSAAPEAIMKSVMR